uniref:Helicase C-terminal domain-containing protein n=1 Tax=Vitis vinifera TaxID=29760 RepID=F6HKE9_VITVI
MKVWAVLTDLGLRLWRDPGEKSKPPTAHMQGKLPDGFKDDSLRIMKDIQRSGAQCQVLLFSATFNDTVKNFVTRIVKDYNQMFVKKEELSLQSVKQYKVKCPDELSKILVIKDKIFEIGQKLGQTIIFVRTKNSAGMLHKALVDFGYEVTTIQGALRQEDRDKIIKEFKDGLTQVLISTDLLARGFDQSRVNLVVNYDLPLKYGTQAEPDYEVYLHRIGRAGRFGRKGAVFNLLCSDKDNILISKIENHFGVQIAEVTYPPSPGVPRVGLVVLLPVEGRHVAYCGPISQPRPPTCYEGGVGSGRYAPTEGL